MRSLTGELWASIEDVYAAILRHPFLTAATSGYSGTCATVAEVTPSIRGIALGC